MTYEFCTLLGERLRVVIEENKRADKYTTIYELSTKSGVPQSVLYRILNGECYDPSFRQMARLAKYLEISLDTFMDSDELQKYDFNSEDPNQPRRRKE